MKACPTCKQTLPHPTHYGLKLGPGDRLLLTAVQKAGPNGLYSDDLFSALYNGTANGGPDSGKAALRVRIYYLNKKLKLVGRKIVSQGATVADYGFYYIKEIEK